MNRIESLDDMGYRLPSMITVVCNSKTLLVKMIQLCRIESPCFATSQGAFCTKQCQWRKDCRKPFMDWLRDDEPNGARGRPH